MPTPVTAPMEGKILRLEKQVGDSVQENEVVVVLEAMKMEIEVVAPCSGRIETIAVEAGQKVEADQVLASIE